MKKAKYYVILRTYLGKRYIMLYDFNEAVKRNWINPEGNRIWISPEGNRVWVAPIEETSPDFVYGFNDLDEAINFYNILSHNEIGVKVEQL